MNEKTIKIKKIGCEALVFDLAERLTYGPASMPIKYSFPPGSKFYGQTTGETPISRRSSVQEIENIIGREIQLGDEIWIGHIGFSGSYFKVSEING